MTRTKKQSTEAAVREIRRKTRRKFAPEEKVRIVLEGLRGEQSISELCRREGIASNLYYRWSKEFLEAGKRQLAGDTVHEATSDEVKDLRAENRELKEVVAEATLKNRVLKYPWELEAALRNFVAYYNNERYHESLDNVTPSDVYFGRQYEIVTERGRIKKRTMRKRKKEYLAAKAA
jgi:transposase